MGVKGLWTLLSASGRCVPLEAIHARVLAVDVSLWLVQFLKAMRNENGEVRHDAHLIGMFKRICRLILCGIRPVFVFDGPPPMLKRKTLALRRRLRDSSELRWKRTAEKILLTQLKLRTIEELRSQIEAAGDRSVDPEELTEIADTVESERINQATKDELAEIFESDNEEDPEFETGAMDSEMVRSRPIVVPDSFEHLDPESLAALPYSMQFEILEKLREDRAHESRVRHIASANTPSNFSSTQLNQFLETSTFNRKIHEVRSKVGGDSQAPSSQAIATMPDTLFYFQKSQSTRKSGKRERQELYRTAKSLEKPIITLSDFHMEMWSCLRCGLSNLAIRRTCQKCGNGYMQSTTSWQCSVCSVTNPELTDNCSSCQHSRRRHQQSLVPDVLDRTAEIDSFLDDDLSETDHEPSAEKCADNFQQETPSSEAFSDIDCIPNESIPQDLLTIRNSRLNFYKLQRQSSMSYTQPEGSRLEDLPGISDSSLAEDSTKPVFPSGCYSDAHSPFVGLSDSNSVAETLSDASDFENTCEIHKEASVLLASTSSDDTVANVVSFHHPADPQAVEPVKQSASFALTSSDSLDAQVNGPAHPDHSVDNAQHYLSPSRVSQVLPNDTEQASSTLQASGALVEGCTDTSSVLVPISLPQSDESRGPVVSREIHMGPLTSPSLTLDIAEPKPDDSLVALRSAQARHLRDADQVTDEMIQETQSLLQLFGIPFVRAPAEAEAQCAALEILGLVDGVVTDDSDVFLFGARHVFRNMFSSDKKIERYLMDDIERELGVDRDKLIQMALLLGSDYTDGIHGIGIVNAIEIVNSFENLEEFRDWVYSDGSDESEFSDLEAENERLIRLNQFKVSHRNIRRNWEVPRDFPNKEVISTYLHPPVDKSEEKFSWGQVDVERLKQFCMEHLQWGFEKTEGLLAPVVRKLQKSSYQTRLEAYFGKGENAARISSKRIKLAVNSLKSKRRK